MPEYVNSIGEADLEWIFTCNYEDTDRCKERQINYRAADKRAALFLMFNGKHEKTPVLAYRSFFTQILKKGDV